MLNGITVVETRGRIIEVKGFDIYELMPVNRMHTKYTWEEICRASVVANGRQAEFAETAILCQRVRARCGLD